MKSPILVAGIGNIFKGDDGFGVEVVRRLAHRFDDVAVEVVDFGIRGLDLAYELLEGDFELVILVDIVQRGAIPGTIYVIDPDFETIDEREAIANTHAMHPAKVLSWVKALGGRPGPIRIVACEPLEVGNDEDLKVGLSPAVEMAVDHAVRSIEQLVDTALCRRT